VANQGIEINFVYLTMDSIKDIVSVDSEIVGGQTVFAGTRVPVESLFLHLEKGVSLNEFLEDFPSVSRHQAVTVLELAEKLFASSNILRLYEIAA
jgi:uncharacterized protein (DUF433 family)